MFIVSVDDKSINSQVILYDLNDYFKTRNIDFYFIEFNSGFKVIEYLKNNFCDVLFIDYEMPDMNGIDTIKIIKEMNVETKIVIVTPLYSKEAQNNGLIAGADFFISKPYCNQEIGDVMNKIEIAIKDRQILDVAESEEIEEFMDFDEFDDFDNDFMDLDNDSQIEDQKQLMEDFNESHKKVSASDFLLEYPYIDEYVEDLNLIESRIYFYLDELNGENLNSNLIDILDIFDMYANFFNSFSEFTEISTALQLLRRVLNNTPLGELTSKKKDFTARYLLEILNDMVAWKDHVFVEQDAVDVFYINASLLNSCIQLEALLKK
jgi:CheY-like chemotaxis protein